MPRAHTPSPPASPPPPTPPPRSSAAARGTLPLAAGRGTSWAGADELRVEDTLWLLSCVEEYQAHAPRDTCGPPSAIFTMLMTLVTFACRFSPGEPQRSGDESPVTISRSALRTSNFVSSLRETNPAGGDDGRPGRRIPANRRCPFTG